jgi:putative transposase
VTETIEPMAAQIDQQQLAQELVEQARAEGVQLVGEGGLLSGLTKSVLETALDAEMGEHLGYDKHDPAGRNGGNSRNGYRVKTVLTEIGPVEVEVPRNRDGSFEPAIVRKRQRRLDGIDEIVLSLTARGLTTGDIAAHFAEVYGFAAGDVVGGGDGADVVGGADVLTLALLGAGVPGCGACAPCEPQAAIARPAAVRSMVVSRRFIGLASLEAASLSPPTSLRRRPGESHPRCGIGSPVADRRYSSGRPACRVRLLHGRQH